MKIAKDTVVRFEYTLRDAAGEVLDSGAGDEALAYLHGHSMIVPGLEAALDGREAGESVKVVVAAKDGYGERDPEGVVELPRDRFPPKVKLEEGMQLATRSADGRVLRMQLVKVGLETVQVDFNHPLAGKDLHFDVAVKEVRAATPEELAHGHMHCAPGHCDDNSCDPGHCDDDCCGHGH
jgi:FKBP-type peptidyl-prolyl cis-trans isomerase SlyD